MAPSSLVAIFFGDFFFSDLQEKFFPDEYDMTDELPAEVKTKIGTTYDQLGSLLKEDAMEEYLKTAAEINGYGIERYQVTTRERKNETLEMASTGMMLYPSTKVCLFSYLYFKLACEQVRDSFEPVMLNWNDIRNVTSSGNKVTIKFVDKHKASKLIKTDRAKQAQEIVHFAEVRGQI